MSFSHAPDLADADALFVDFDGTLAGLQSDPDTVALPPEMFAALRRIADRLDGALAIVSGRDLRDLAARTPDDLWRVGAHGLEAAAPREPVSERRGRAPDALRAALDAFAAQHPGVFVEDKGPVLTLHYRAKPEAGPGARAAVEAAVATVEGYRAQVGKFVVEAKPIAAHKGAAIRRLMALPPFAGRRPVMVGDDATDEDAFSFVRAAGGVAIKVGEGETCADARLADPDAVLDWLRRNASS